MNVPITFKFGGYQKPASIHNQAAVRFGEALRERLATKIDYQLIGNALDLGWNDKGRCAG